MCLKTVLHPLFCRSVRHQVLTAVLVVQRQDDRTVQSRCGCRPNRLKSRVERSARRRFWMSWTFPATAAGSGNLSGVPVDFLPGAGGKQSGQGTPAAGQHPPRAIPELVATAPGQVYTWDITKLAGPVRGEYFDCYMMVDIHSRFIVGAHVHATESGVLAMEMMRGTFGIHGIPHIVHADRSRRHSVRELNSLIVVRPLNRHQLGRLLVPDPQSQRFFGRRKNNRVHPVTGSKSGAPAWTEWRPCPLLPPSFPARLRRPQ